MDMTKLENTLKEILAEFVAFIDDLVNKYLTGIEIEIDLFK